MKKAIGVLISLVFSVMGAWAASPEEYALMALQKDLPRVLGWYEKLYATSDYSQVEVYELYRKALPEVQANQQKGLSVRGSIEKLIILVEGTRYFEALQKASLGYQQNLQVALQYLQFSKDHLDRFERGEDPQVLLDESHANLPQDYTVLAHNVVSTLMELQTLLREAPLVAAQDSGVEQVQVGQVQNEDSESSDVSESATAEVVSSAIAPEVSSQTFEKERFASFSEGGEKAVVAPECTRAQVWQTDVAPKCQIDDPLECDRQYARQCKKLQ